MVVELNVLIGSIVCFCRGEPMRTNIKLLNPKDSLLSPLPGWSRSVNELFYCILYYRLVPGYLKFMLK